MVKYRSLLKDEKKLAGSNDGGTAACEQSAQRGSSKEPAHHGELVQPSLFDLD